MMYLRTVVSLQCNSNDFYPTNRGSATTMLTTNTAIMSTMRRTMFKPVECLWPLSGALGAKTHDTCDGRAAYPLAEWLIAAEVNWTAGVTGSLRNARVSKSVNMTGLNRSSSYDATPSSVKSGMSSSEYCRPHAVYV